MKGPEKVYINKKLVCLIIRKDMNVKEGISFFTKPSDPLQLAVQNHIKKHETKVHNNNLAKPLYLTHKHKYIYIIKGSAEVQLMTDTTLIKHRVVLKRGDSIIIRNVLHKITFASGTKIIEIKQGPYEQT